MMYFLAKSKARPLVHQSKLSSQDFSRNESAEHSFMELAGSLLLFPLFKWLILHCDGLGALHVANSDHQLFLVLR